MENPGFENEYWEIGLNSAKPDGPETASQKPSTSMSSTFQPSVPKNSYQIQPSQDASGSQNQPNTSLHRPAAPIHSVFRKSPTQTVIQPFSDKHLSSKTLSARRPSAPEQQLSARQQNIPNMEEAEAAAISISDADFNSLTVLDPTADLNQSDTSMVVAKLKLHIEKLKGRLVWFVMVVFGSLLTLRTCSLLYNMLLPSPHHSFLHDEDDIGGQTCVTLLPLFPQQPLVRPWPPHLLPTPRPVLWRLAQIPSQSR